MKEKQHNLHFFNVVLSSGLMNLCHQLLANDKKNDCSMRVESTMSFRMIWSMSRFVFIIFTSYHKNHNKLFHCRQRPYSKKSVCAHSYMHTYTNNELSGWFNLHSIVDSIFRTRTYWTECHILTVLNSCCEENGKRPCVNESVRTKEAKFRL